MDIASFGVNGPALPLHGRILPSGIVQPDGVNAQGKSTGCAPLRLEIARDISDTFAAPRSLVPA